MDAKKCKVEVTIPDALIMEIFGKLPVKSLCRFKCVSKFWRSFIQDQSFINKISPKPPFKWVVLDEEMFQIYSIDSNAFATRIHKYEFEYGIIECFKYYDGLHCSYSEDMGLCMYNPATDESIQLDFDPPCSRFEFSFDPLSKKYKVLGWRKCRNVRVLDFQILTLEDGFRWRSVANTLGIRDLEDATTAFDGRLFWTELTRIISFNLANEEFGEIGLPAEFTANDGFQYSLFEFEGSLALVEQRIYEERVISFWMLKEVDGGNIWNPMKMNITLHFEGTFLDDFYDDDIVWALSHAHFSSHGGEILICLTAEHDIYVFCYSPLSGQVKLMTITGLLFGDYKVVNYIENYLSLEELVGLHD